VAFNAPFSSNKRSTTSLSARRYRRGDVSDTGSTIAVSTNDVCTDSLAGDTSVFGQFGLVPLSTRREIEQRVDQE
jgi:hypothetical protein